MNTDEKYTLRFWGKVPKEGMIIEWDLHEIFISKDEADEIISGDFDYQIAMVRSHIKKVIGEQGVACGAQLERGESPVKFAEVKEEFSKCQSYYEKFRKNGVFNG